jgi:hypothetical protein
VLLQNPDLPKLALLFGRVAGFYECRLDEDHRRRSVVESHPSSKRRWGRLASKKGREDLAKEYRQVFQPVRLNIHAGFGDDKATSLEIVHRCNITR